MPGDPAETLTPVNPSENPEMRKDHRQPRKNLGAAQSQHRAAGRPWKRSDIFP